MEVARINPKELEEETGVLVHRLRVLSLVAAINAATVALVDLTTLATRSGSGEEEEGGSSSDGEDASKHGVEMKVGWW